MSDEERRFIEAVGGRSVDGNEALAGTPVRTADGLLAGTVDGVEGKYFQVRPAEGKGDTYWLSITAVQHADRDEVRLNFDGQSLAAWALTAPGNADAADPRIDEQADALSDEETKVERREGLIR